MANGSVAATRDDLKDLKNDLKGDLKDLKADHNELKSDLKDLRVDLKGDLNRFTDRFFKIAGLFLAGITVVAGIVMGAAELIWG